MENLDLKHQNEDYDIPEHFNKRIRKIKRVLVVFVMLTVFLVLAVLFILYYRPSDKSNSGFNVVVTETEKSSTPGKPHVPPPGQDGVYYEVQIGAFKDFNLEKYNENLVNLGIEKEGGVYKYSLGRFSDYQEALFFENDLKRMGFSDAFIIAKEDGLRIDLDSLLQSKGY